jgi:glycosyltransferase involved in cell wall biosynthesis
VSAGPEAPAADAARRPPASHAERLRVCILLERYPPEFSGHGIQTHRLLPYLEAEGIDPVVVCCRPPPGLPPWPDPAPVHRVLAPDRSGALGTLQRWHRIRRFLAREHARLDVVHAALQGWELFANTALMERLGLPLVFEMVLLGSDDPVTISRYRFGRRKLATLSGVRAWLGISEAFRDSVRRAGLEETRFRCIHTGVDMERFRPASPAERASLRDALELPADARVVVSCGVLIPRKGMDRVLRGWAAAGPRAGRDHLLLVGPRSVEEGVPPRFAGHPDELRELAKSLGVADTVRLLGHTNEPERVLRAADAFVFLSRREGLGNVVIESLACGLPCVVSPLDGIGHELLEEGETGHVIADPDDAQAVGACIAGLLDEPERRAAMGRAAHAEARRRFSMGVRARALAEVYRSVVAEARGRSTQTRPRGYST